MRRFSYSSIAFWKQPFALELMRLSWPLCVSMLSYSVMTLVDTLFIGSLGTEPLAAIGLAGVMSFAVLSFGAGTFRAGKIAISQAAGANRFEQIPALVGAILALVAVLSLGSVLVGQAAAWLLPKLTQDTEVGRLAQQYTSLRTLGAPISLTALALAQARIAVGDTRASMRASLVANLANIPLNALLIFGLQLGIEGAAIGSVLAQGLQVVILIAAQRPDGFGLKRWTLQDVRKVWHFGLPGGIESFLDMGAMVALTIVLARMPTQQLAAHQVALQIVRFSFLPLNAISEATSVLTARAVGGARDGDVSPCCLSARKLSLAVATSTGVILLLLRDELCAPFTQDSTVVSLASQLLLVFIPMCFANAFYASSRGGLRGTGDVRFTTRVTVLCAWLVTPPFAYLLGLYFQMGAFGTWLALTIEISIGAGWVSWRLARSGWLQAAAESRRRLSLS